ncbi:hypothetical protein ABC270_13270 [Curtobacterium sp. 1P10AnD]|uniref:hypothetical protein n=1 Tax=Curtobacterium sp. 1P10AnD TaxID=3132283 RepID=UPI0039A21323
MTLPPDLTAVAGVLVTAALGAIAVVREQSAMRQLERITAILKDAPEGTITQRRLQVLQEHLTHRVSLQYRLPKGAEAQFLGLTMAGSSIALLLITLFDMTTSLNRRVRGHTVLHWYWTQDRLALWDYLWPNLIMYGFCFGGLGLALYVLDRRTKARKGVAATIKENEVYRRLL